MDFTAVFVITISFLFINHLTEGRQFSHHHDFELESELKILNKPAIKTISTSYGDIYDCVDIYKQPSFDHPLLRNHTLQMKPSFVPNTFANKSLPEEIHPRFGLEGGGCPEGSVPIRRIQKEDLMRVRAYLNKYPDAVRPNTMDKPGWHFAMSVTDKVQIPFHGARGNINIQNFNVEKEQHSDSVIYLSRGQLDQQNSIYAGWSVFPAVYGDSKTRFYTTWTADGNKKTGCVDIHCPGFVQVNKEFPLGIPIGPVSVHAGPQYGFSVSIFQDEFSGNWWLVAGLSVMVGYWPKEVFTGMQGYADEVGWGGRVYSPTAASPAMGSGLFAEGGWGKACFVTVMQFERYGQGIFEDVKQNQLVDKVDVPRCYDLNSYLDSQGRCNFYFGGPGGACGYLE